MSDLGRWQEENDAYLVAALVWLRLRLRRLADTTDIPPPDAAAKPERRKVFGLERRRPMPALPAPHGLGEEELQRAAEAMHAAEAGMHPPPALRLMGERLGLSPFEQQVLLLCAAMEFDTGTAELCRAAHGYPHPTFALALALFDQPAWDVRSPERPLRYWRLLDIAQPGALSLTSSPLRADERIVNALKGLSYLDERLRTLLTPLEHPPSHHLSASQQRVVERAAAQLRRNHAPLWPVLQLIGNDAASLQLVARHAAATLGLPLYHLPVENIPSYSADLETLARLWQRESLLGQVGLYLDAFELEPGAAAHSALLRFLARTDGIIFLAGRDVHAGLGRPSQVHDVGKPTSGEQHNLWLTLLGRAGETDLNPLAAQFDLGAEAIGQVVREALEPGPDTTDDRPLQTRLWDGCRQASRPRLESLAQRLDAGAGWDDLVLPEPELRLLRQLAAQVGARHTVYQDWGFGAAMRRGFGISALFAGESGTGKTLAAEVIAHALQLDLYRIDLSSVVSKYIGETEKNLRRLFDAAESGGVILFFDEADALFGKRSEVKDAHDRYANIEVNYLLQRMEAYRGLAILATNMKSALDPAFVRRLRFIVDFPFPNASDRHRMWERVFPVSTPREGLELERLAKLELSGANIHSAALNAAFLAAARAAPVGMVDVLEAARNELRKLGRPINEADFRWRPKEVAG